LHPAVRREPNDARVLDFLAHGLADHTTETMFAGIDQLAPGSWLRVSPTAGVGRQQRWYRAEPARLEGPPAQAFRDLLVDRVGFRLRSDVPLGVALSGGLDSSSVLGVAASLAAAEGVSPPDAFTARTREPGEWPWAQQAAEAAGARHHEIWP